RSRKVTASSDFFSQSSSEVSRKAGIASASRTKRPPLPKVRPSDSGSTKHQRRHPATWKRSISTVKRSYSSRPHVLASYIPKSMGEWGWSRKGRSRIFQLAQLSPWNRLRKGVPSGPKHRAGRTQPPSRYRKVLTDRGVPNYGEMVKR